MWITSLKLIIIMVKSWHGISFLHTDLLWGESPHTGLAIKAVGNFFAVILNKLLNKTLWYQWLKTSLLACDITVIKTLSGGVKCAINVSDIPVFEGGYY